MFDQAELSVFEYGDFEIIDISKEHIEIKSNATDQYWLIQKFTSSAFPPVVLFHKHTSGGKYHVHFVYDVDNALLAYSEIRQHDRYILKRDKKRKSITKKTNLQLLQAADCI